MERRRFNAEFKREAVRLATQPGSSRAQVAQELGLNATMLGQVDPGGSLGQMGIDSWQAAEDRAATGDRTLETGT